MNIQEEIKELRNRLDKLERQVNQDGIISRYTPKPLEEYYYVNSLGVIIREINNQHNVDDYRISIGNCFKTQEEAEKHKRVLINTQRLKDLADELNGTIKIDWRDEYPAKYYIMLNERGLSIGEAFFCRLQGTVYCVDKNFLAKAIEEIGKEELIELIKGE